MAGLDVLIVGSGFEGAVAAARLAAAGAGVLVLERGPWWGVGAEAVSAPARPFPRGGWGSRKLLRNVCWARRGHRGELTLFRDGLFEWTVFDRLHVVSTSGVGGGSLVYANLLVDPDEALFAGFPSELTLAELRPYLDRVHAMLHPQPVPVEQRGARAAAFTDAGAHAGFPTAAYPSQAVAWGRFPDHPEPVTNAAGITQTTCRLTGTCIVGCPYGSKTTLDLTYLPAALRTGAEIRPLAEVVAIGREGSQYWVRWIDHRTGQEHEQHAPTLVLAAGTLGTLRLLYRARDRDRTLPGLPAALGRHFSPNGDVFSLLWRTARLTGNDQRSPSVIAAGCAFPDGRYRFFVAEGGMSPQAGLPGWLRAALASSTLLICTGRDCVDGRVTFDGRGLRTEVSRYDDPALFDDIDRAVDALAASYRPRRRFTGLPGMAPNTLLSVHPLGGASLSTHPADGVTDHAGQVHGHPGLYVADGSLYPVAPGFPPALTIAALSERIAELITHKQP